eukprot:Blabericola_migrator_1__2732@NODE_1778_length_3809_cov_13_107162_g1145_i0_p1_GENE_NODE_1778_length_3809_cov_13_107162_g1145_i0NODE_1778_length_3809_cov_13_107162_g1145_i0_p1_ORF_typecomplete_len1171_score182_14_NODE_1778_length_3809_cov_13_107162_g1145_i0793591
MPGTGRCILHSYKEYSASKEKTIAVNTFGFGVCCVLSMYRVSKLADDEAQPNPTFNAPADSYRETLREEKSDPKLGKTRFTSAPLKYPTECVQRVRTAFESRNLVTSGAVEHQDELCEEIKVESLPREAIRETKPTNKAPPHASDEAWHKRAQYLLAHSQRLGEKDLWDQMAEILGEAKKVLRAHGFSNDQKKILAQIVEAAVNFAPLYPCVALCAELVFSLNENPPAQKEQHNANVVSPESDQDRQVLSQSEESEKMLQSEAKHQCPPVFGPDFWTRPPWFPIQCASWDENPRCAKELKQGGPAVSPDSGNDAARGVSAASPEVVHDDAMHEILAAVKEDAASLATAIEEAILHTGGQPGPVGVLNVGDQLDTLLASLSQLCEKPPPRDTQTLTVFSSMCSSLMAKRAQIKSSSRIRLTRRHMGRLNKAIFTVSRLWHQARLANLKGIDALSPQQLESIRKLPYSAEKSSIMTYVASAAYAGLLIADSEEEAKEVLNDFFTYFDLTIRSIDSSTAQLYLLMLLHLKYDNVKLLKPKARNLLDRLIVRLRDKIHGAEKCEILVSDLPELEEFHQACLGASTWQIFDWRDSLRLDATSTRDGQRPIITKLVLYGHLFREGLDQFIRSYPITRGTCAAQVKLLKAFRLHLLSIISPEHVFTDDQTLAYVRQFVAFAERCLDECLVNGSAASHKQVLSLEVTLNCLQWCRLLSSYLGVDSLSFLEEAYSMTAYALILKNLWSSPPTTSLSNSERVSISQGILSALRSDKSDDELLACTKMFIDQYVPPRFVTSLFDELLAFSFKQDSDHDKMMTLVALECRIQLFKAKIATGLGVKRVPGSTQERFTEALAQARVLARSVTTSQIPDALNASLRERFVASHADEAARNLSVDVALEGALQMADSDSLTVAEVAHHLATYLLGDSADESWLNFLTYQTRWCSFTAQQLAEREDDLLTLVRSLKAPLKGFWVEPLGGSVEATPDLIRLFLHMATLKWLCGKITGIRNGFKKGWHVLNHVASEYAFVWIRRWLVLMHSRQALFPVNNPETANLFEEMCFDLALQRHYVTAFSVRSKAPLDTGDVIAHLRRILKRVGSGVLITTDLKVLLEACKSPVLSRESRSVFLAFLLWTWHNKCLPLDAIEDCIMTVMQEGQCQLSVNTMQECVKKLLKYSTT